LKMPDEKDLIAPEGKVWVCLACGKTSRHKYGDEDRWATGWDVSCTLNCDLFDEKDLVRNEHGRVVSIKRPVKEEVRKARESIEKTLEEMKSAGDQGEGSESLPQRSEGEDWEHGG